MDPSILIGIKRKFSNLTNNNIDNINNSSNNRNNNNNNNSNDTPSHQLDIAAHYNSIIQKSVSQRNLSRIIGLKSFNNWVKSVLINEYCISNNKATVLDICCGKGGDLKKYLHGISYYI